MENSLAVANYFIDKALVENKDLTPMKLLKLVYISHGWHLGLYDEPLVKEQVYAWKYGPVIREVYDEFKKFGNNQISSFASNCSQMAGKSAFLNRIWEVYKDFDGLQLSTLTHQTGTPWEVVTTRYSNGILPQNLLIPNEIIEQYYKKLSNERG